MNRKQRAARLERLKAISKIAAERRRLEAEAQRVRMLAWEAEETAKHIWAELLEESERAARALEDKPLTGANERW